MSAATAVGAARTGPGRPAPGGRGPRGRWTRDRVETAVLRVLRWVVVVGLLLFALFPFAYMVLLSFRDLTSLVAEPGRLLPTGAELTLQTYRDVLAPEEDGGQGFLGLIRNSLVVALLTVVVSLALALPGAYAVARLRFRGRRQVSVLFLAVYLFPAILLAVPLFIAFTRLGLRGQLAGLVLVYVAQTVAVSVYMLRSYFRTVPASVEEAAAMDGAGRLGVLRHVVLPLAVPAIAANALLVFMIAWNEFLFALLFLVEDRPRWTVSLGLSQLSGSLEIPTTVLMAGSVVLTLPVVLLFFASERLLRGGLTAGAEKG